MQTLHFNASSYLDDKKLQHKLSISSALRAYNVWNTHSNSLHIPLNLYISKLFCLIRLARRQKRQQ